MLAIRCESMDNMLLNKHNHRTYNGVELKTRNGMICREPFDIKLSMCYMSSTYIIWGNRSDKALYDMRAMYLGEEYGYRSLITVLNTVNK